LTAGWVGLRTGIDAVVAGRGFMCVVGIKMKLS